jgi:hypothetical protein
MGLLVKPGVKVEDIKIEADENSESVDRVVNEFRNKPVMMIGGYVLGMGELRSLNINVRLNSLPTFTCAVNDEQYLIRGALKNDIDKGVLFFGWRKSYYKFNCLFNTTYSEAGDAIMELSGMLYNEKLYNGKQVSFKDKSITDIMKDICNATSMGLYTYDDADLNFNPGNDIMPGTRYIDHFTEIITRYTSAVFCIDPLYHFHVGNMDTIRRSPVDKYTVDWSTGEALDTPVDMVFKSKLKEGEPGVVDKKIPVDWYTVDTNYSDVHYSTYNEYRVGIDGDEVKKLKTSSNLGIGSNQLNTFKPFKDHVNPWYQDRVNKLMAGNIIKMHTSMISFELCPLGVIETELYLPFTSGDKAIRKDEEHSGKKVVIGYEVVYNKSLSKDEADSVHQVIEVI